MAKALRVFVMVCLGVCLLAQPSDARLQVGGHQPSNPFVISGVVTNQLAKQQLSNFVDWLSTASGYPMHLAYARNYSDLSRTLRENPNAIGWTCGAPFVEDHDNDGQQLIGVPLFNGRPTYHSVVLTHERRTETRLIDFRGGVLAYSDRRSNSGFLAPGVALKRHGIDINEYFRLMLNAGNHEGSLEALVSGLADVAAVDEYIWENFQRDQPEAAATLKEVERFGPFPFTPIVAGSQVNSSVIRHMQDALSSMAEDPRGSVVLDGFKLDGFVVRDHRFYQPIRDALQFMKGD